MNPWLLAGGLLVLGAATAHSLLGEKVVLRRLFRRTGEEHAPGRRASDDPQLRALLRLTWHSVSVALVGLAALLFAAAVRADVATTATLRVVAATLLGLALLSLLIARGRHIGWMWYAVAALTTWMSA